MSPHHCHNPSEVASFHQVRELWTMLKGCQGSVPAEIKVLGLTVMHTPKTAKAAWEKGASGPLLLKMLVDMVLVGLHLSGCWDDPCARHGARTWLGEATGPGRWEVLLGPAPAHTNASTATTSWAECCLWPGWG